MRRLGTLLISTILALAFYGCGGDDNSKPDAKILAPDAKVDAKKIDARIPPDAFWTPSSASHLGEACDGTSAAACGGGTGDYLGYFCLGFDATTHAGYCTFYCQSDDSTPCQTGFPEGHGFSACEWGVQKGGENVGFACGILCGDTQWPQAYGDVCPSTLTCRDEFTCTSDTYTCTQTTPGTADPDGKNDFCWP